MPVFDDKVKEVLEYAATVGDGELQRKILVSLVREKARSNGTDLLEHFYRTPPHMKSPYLSLNGVNDACNYLIIIPLLDKLYKVTFARGESNVVFNRKPGPEEVEKLTEEIKRRK